MHKSKEPPAGGSFSVKLYYGALLSQLAVV